MDKVAIRVTLLTWAFKINHLIVTGPPLYSSLCCSQLLTQFWYISQPHLKWALSEIDFTNFPPTYFELLHLVWTISALIFFLKFLWGWRMTEYVNYYLSFSPLLQVLQEVLRCYSIPENLFTKVCIIIDKVSYARL